MLLLDIRSINMAAEDEIIDFGEDFGLVKFVGADKTDDSPIKFTNTAGDSSVKNTTEIINESTLDESMRRNTEFITDIQKLKSSGETISSSQLNALEKAYKAKGGDDFSLIKLMGHDGDMFFEQQMDKLRYGSDMLMPKPTMFADIDMEAEPAKPWRIDKEKRGDGGFWADERKASAERIKNFKATETVDEVIDYGDEVLDFGEEFGTVKFADDAFDEIIDFGEEFGTVRFSDADDVALPVISKPEIITPDEMARAADAIDPMRVEDFGIDRETGELSKPKSSRKKGRLKFGRESKLKGKPLDKPVSKPTAVAKPLLVGTPTSTSTVADARKSAASDIAEAAMPRAEASAVKASVVSSAPTKPVTEAASGAASTTRAMMESVGDVAKKVTKGHGGSTGLLVAGAAAILGVAGVARARSNDRQRR